MTIDPVIASERAARSKQSPIQSPLTWAWFIPGLLLALALRLSQLNFSSMDYQLVLRRWFETLLESGFAALGTDFANYTPLYLYILYLSVRIVIRTPLSGKLLRMTGLKVPSLVADLFLAGIGAAIVNLKYPRSRLTLLAGLAILFTPTVIMNSAMWGQADAVYTAALLACLFFLLLRRPYWAMLAFGLAFAFKLQALFFAPLLVVLLIRRQLPWRSLLLAPLPYLLSLIPAWLAGRPLPDLLTIYLKQSGEYAFLTNHAPNLYAWLPQSAYPVLFPAGLLFALLAACLLIFFAARPNIEYDNDLILQLATLSVLLVPFVTPKMHERYFYPADVITILYAFYFPRFFYVPLLTIGASLFAYLPFLYGKSLLPGEILPVFVLAALIVVGRHFYLSLYEHSER
jgi:Gpi18-like mannosyltransferase